LATHEDSATPKLLTRRHEASRRATLHAPRSTPSRELFERYVQRAAAADIASTGIIASGPRVSCGVKLEAREIVFRMVFNTRDGDRER
jgi:hypothetical protein